jgi:hypothetical protein
MSRGVSLRELRQQFDVSKLGPNSPLREILKQKARAPSRDLEHQSQVSLFDWARDQEEQWPELARLFAVPNFSGRLGKKTARHGARLNAEGRKKGIPDVWFPVRRGHFVGLVIEMKAGRNQPTKEQNDWLAHLHRSGWRIFVAWSMEEAKRAILEYLELPGAP